MAQFVIDERPFYCGDQVRLKADGREMVVVALRGDEIQCEWVERDVLIDRDWFRPEDIEMIRTGFPHAVCSPSRILARR